MLQRYGSQKIVVANCLVYHHLNVMIAPGEQSLLLSSKVRRRKGDSA